MDTFLWILAAALAFAFAMSGSMKLFSSIESLREKMDWTSDFSHRTIQSIGALEIAGALALILPPLLGVVEVLTPLAAVGLVILMLGAMTVHARRGGEGQMIMVNVVLAVLAAVLAWGRFGPEPF